MRTALAIAILIACALSTAAVTVEVNWEMGGGKAYVGMTSFFKVTIRNNEREETPRAFLAITVEDKSLHLSGPLEWQNFLLQRAKYTHPFHYGEVDTSLETEPVAVEYNKNKEYYFGIEADERCQPQSYTIRVAVKTKNPDSTFSIADSKDLKLQVEESVRLTVPSADLAVGGEMKVLQVRVENQGNSLEKLKDVSTEMDILTPECVSKILFCDRTDRMCTDTEWKWKPERKTVSGSIERETQVEYRMKVDPRFFCNDPETCGKCDIRLNASYTTDFTDLLIKRSVSSQVKQDNIPSLTIRTGESPKTSVKLSKFKEERGELFFEGRVDEVVQVPLLIKNTGTVFAHGCRAVWEIKRFGNIPAGDLFEFVSPAKATADGSDLKSDKVVIELLKPGEEKEVVYSIRVKPKNAEPGEVPATVEVYCNDAFSKPYKAQKEGEWSKFYINVTFPPSPDVSLDASADREVDDGGSVTAQLVATNRGEYPASNCSLTSSWEGAARASGTDALRIDGSLERGKPVTRSMTFSFSIPAGEKEKWKAAPADASTPDPRTTRQQLGMSGTFNLACTDKFGKTQVTASSSVSLQVREKAGEHQARKKETEDAAMLRLYLFLGTGVAVVVFLVVVYLQRQKKARLRAAGRSPGAPGQAPVAPSPYAAGYYGARYPGYYPQQGYQQYGYPPSPPPQ